MLVSTISGCFSVKLTIQFAGSRERSTPMTPRLDRPGRGRRSSTRNRVNLSGTPCNFSTSASADTITVASPPSARCPESQSILLLLIPVAAPDGSQSRPCDPRRAPLHGSTRGRSPSDAPPCRPCLRFRAVWCGPSTQIHESLFPLCPPVFSDIHLRASAL